MIDKLIKIARQAWRDKNFCDDRCADGQRCNMDDTCKLLAEFGREPEFKKVLTEVADR